MSTSASLPRRAWSHYEPIHAIVYFAPESRERYGAIGLKGGWMGYFASRSAPMGAVSAGVVTAVFHNFAPLMVQRGIPDAWGFASPATVLEARLDAVDAALRRLWGDAVESAEVREAAELALGAAAGLHAEGRPLFAGHAGLTVPAAPHLALWHACSLLREHRFDGHIAVLTGYGVGGLDALLLHVGAGGGVDGDFLRSFRGWTEEEWAAGSASLRERGLLDDGGHLTAAGTTLHDRVEELTDRCAAGPWEAMEGSQRDRLFALLAPLAGRLEGPGGLMYPNPIGVGRPTG